MNWCKECLFTDGHAEGCGLEPNRAKRVSRRHFLRTVGILGTAILVAPSLVQIPSQNALTFAIDHPYRVSFITLSKAYREAQGEMLRIFNTTAQEWHDFTASPDVPKSLLDAKGLYS